MLFVFFVDINTFYFGMIMQRIALTLGEPAGIGVDLCIQLAQQDLPCQLIAIGDPALLAQRAELLGYKLKLREFNAELLVTAHEAGHLTVLPVALAEAVQCGELNVANSAYVLETLKLATQGCLDGKFAAMVTAPVHKGIINDAGFAFSGHTEYIADMTSGHPVMMLATEGLRVALVTTHLPLAEVSKAITAPLIEKVLRVLDHDLRTRFHIAKPRILVCGLNPHAGESGHLGREELEIINPVLHDLRQQGFHLQGALPADSLFTAQYLDSADAVLAMYHDQGLPVLKYKGFGRSVNITLGLPIVRTSVDHGTALGLAGTGLADMGSLRYALDTALTMIKP